MKYLMCGVWLALALAGTATAACDNPVQGKDGEKPNHRLHWTTRSEILSAGFEVFRAESADGDYVKLTDKPLPSGGNSPRPRQYEYKDFAIDPCKNYFYYVEAISENGYRVRLTSPMPAGPDAAKLKAEAEAAAVAKNKAQGEAREKKAQQAEAAKKADPAKKSEAKPAAAPAKGDKPA